MTFDTNYVSSVYGHDISREVSFVCEPGLAPYQSGYRVNEYQIVLPSIIQRSLRTNFVLFALKDLLETPYVV
jgi:hypothetical protein